MRWHVEVSSVNNAERESYTVEAETWQNALQQTRVLRQDHGTMGGFSVELVDEGCRAFDPTTHVRYDVRRERSSRPPRPPAVMFRRSQDPTPEAPITYRELVYLLPSGTNERDAERFLRVQLDGVRNSIANARPGRFIRLAVFDRLFEGKPPIPPLAVLTWKDWRDSPEVTHPRRRSVPEIPPPPQTLRLLVDERTGPPPVEAVAAALDTEAPRRPSPAPRPASESAAAEASTGSSQVLEVKTPAGAKESSVELSEPLLVVIPPELMPPSRPPSKPPSNPPSKPPSNPPASGPASSSRRIVTPVPTKKRQGAAREDTSLTMPAIRPRLKAEELIAAFFEAMHDLHFLRDAVEGADFCLSLALEKLPSQAGLVHLYDIDSRTFVVVATRGAATEPLLLQRNPETDPVLAVAMRRRRAVVQGDASRGGSASLERYASIGGAKSLVAAPVMQAGRFLGALELLNPLDGAPFTEAEGHALTYVGEQLAEFVAPRGVITDPERIRAVASVRPRPG